MRYGHGTDTAIVKRAHFLNTGIHPHRRSAVLFVDDEHKIVDELTAAGVPALHLSELAGLSDIDLETALRYSMIAAKRLHREHNRAQHEVPDTAVG